jgi:hypothetical protein
LELSVLTLSYYLKHVTAVTVLCCSSLIAFAGGTESPVASDDVIQERNERGWQACKKLVGYSKLREDFDVEEATWGYVNRMDEAVFVRLRSTSASGLNAAWWWNPIVDGVPKYSWSNFLACF